MEQKKSSKGSLIIVLLILLVIAIIAIAGYFYVEKTNSDKEIEKLKSNAASMKNTIDELQEKINDKQNNTMPEEDEDEDMYTDDEDDYEYEEITDLFLVTDAVKNDDGTCMLKGEIVTEDTTKEQETEFPKYKGTGRSARITVDADTECIYSEDSYEEETDTVQNVFIKKLYFDRCFNFKFKNGKCTSVYEVVIGH